MKKTATVLSVLFLVSGMAAAQPADTPINSDKPSESEGDMNMMPTSVSNAADGVANIPDKAVNATASIPNAASDTAKAVTSTVSESLGNTVGGIGDAISSIFQ